MLRVFLTVCAIAFLGGFFTGKSVLAQDIPPVYWAAKPVQCGETEYALDHSLNQGLTPIFGGYGWSHSVNYEEPIPVFITLHMNPENNAWVLMETGANGDETCIIGNGEHAQFKTDDILNLIMSLGKVNK